MPQNVEQVPSPQQRLRAARVIDYWRIMVGRRRMILLVTLAAAVIGLLHALLLPNIYTAKTMILPSQEDKGLSSALLAQMGGLATLASGAGVAIGGTSSVDLYVSMLKSEAVKDPIIDRFRLMDLYKAKYRTETYAALDSKALIAAGKKDGIITIEVDDKDPKRAAALANAYVEELGNLAIRLSTTGAGQNRSFLEQRLGRAKADLVRAEEDLRGYQTRNKAVQVTAQAEAAIKGVAELKGRLAVQEVQLATLRRQFTDSSQEVKNAAMAVGNLRAQLAKLEGAGGSSAVPSFGSLPGISQDYVRLLRELKIQESLVESLSKQDEIAKLSQAKDVFPFQVLLTARVPDRKSKPARSKIVLTWVFGALFLSVCLVLVQEQISPSDTH